MRVDSMLFTAILFACCNTSSASAISTPVRSLTSKREDDAARGAFVETTKEERAPLMLGVENIKEGVDAKASIMENIIHKGLELHGKYGADAYKTLHLDQENSKVLRNARLNAWLRYVEKRANADYSKRFTLIDRRNYYEEDDGLLHLLVELGQDASQRELHDKVESVLILSLDKHKRTSKSFFDQLGLAYSFDVDLFNLWRRYTYRNGYLEGDTIFKVINAYDGKVGVRLLGELRQIKKEEKFVKELEESLLDTWAEKRIPVNRVFKWLNLAKEKDNSFFDFWIQYVLKVCDNLHTEEEKMVVELLADYGEAGSLDMFCKLVHFKRGKDLQAKLKSAVLDTWHKKGLNEVDVSKLLWGEEEPDKTKVTYRGFMELLKQYRQELKQMQT